MKKCGILLPVFSLPSEYGIGTFGKSAYDFIDFLCECGQSFWQILPLSQTSYGDSPYQSPSAFAGNPYFIDPDILVKKGYLEPAELKSLTKATGYIDYGRVYEERYPLLRKAYSAFKAHLPKDYSAFLEENADWLDSYAFFMAIKDEIGGGDFHTFPEEYLHRKDIKKMEERFSESADFYKFLQYEFSVQWQALRKYANKKGIKIIGDIPIYVSADSADVWGNSEEFLLDEDLCPVAVAGVPPDAFSEDGQLWGNPLYNWEKMKENGYSWWCRRIGHAVKLYDKIRIDHFVGFSNYFSIPKDAGTPAEGKIVIGPRYALFECIREAHPDADIIAEDLGMMQDGVEALLRMTGFPGMKVIQFSFDGEDNPHAPENHTENTVVYTGTHDNPTAKGFFLSLDRGSQIRYSRLLPKSYTNTVDRIIAYAMASVSETVIIPIQDYMRLGNEARINAPSTTESNWAWTIPENYNRAPLKRRILQFAKESGRAKK